MDRMRTEYCASLAVAAWFGVSSCALATPHAALAAAGNVVLVGAALTVYAALMTVVGVRWSLWHSLLLSGWTVAAAIVMGGTANAVLLLLIALAAIAVSQWALVLEKKQRTDHPRHARRCGGDSAVHADDFAAHVDEWTTRVAGIDRRIGL